MPYLLLGLYDVGLPLNIAIANEIERKYFILYRFTKLFLNHLKRFHFSKLPKMSQQ